ncbi:MarR family winged helix-turn-helix transcriptional regulator [Wenjunlia tyrosinilytica]|uniref:Transcriptional regulator n=1 Tax=Wenjunlia tyrosinilytica TaxID=1544741 RepID=A0A917ZXV0_9ACTN|nr:MarR family transcriptional regulator [Wenjunlia tyrosinilytica]GGO96275.1 transcriptional regulator [Wenjunlia tyrosinilytica]
MPEEPDNSLVARWRELLALHATTWCELDRQLHERHGIGASEFEVLDRLSEGSGATAEPMFRVQELAGSAHLSQSALSRLVGRLEKDGLVERTMCSDDRRGVYVCLTDTGRQRVESARPTHRAVLGRQLTGRPADARDIPGE